MSTARSCTLSATLAVLLPAAAPLLAQPDRPAFRDVIEVNVIDVDVHVTDRHGAPITGLGRDAFQLFEHDKKKVKPTYFAEIDGLDDTADPLSLILFVDSYNLRSANRDRALADLAAALEQALRARPLPTAVVSFDGDFDVIQEATLDIDAVLAALDSLSERPAGDDRIENLLRGPEASVRDALRQARGDGANRRVLMATIDSVFHELRGYGTAILGDTRRTLAALSTYVQSQAMTPGRKAVIYISDGFALRPFGEVMRTVQSLISGAATRSEELVESRAGTAGEAGSATLSDDGVMSRDLSFSVDRGEQDLQPLNATPLLERLAAEANTYRVSFYPIKAPPGDALAARSRDRARPAGITLHDMREGLELLAQQTGGRAVTTESGIEQFVLRAIASLTHYYSLGITPAKKADGEVTPLRVKVKAKGARVSYRASYVQRTFGSRLADRTLGGLAVGASDNPHRMEADLLSQQSGEDELEQVTVTFMLPIAEIGLAEQSGVHRADASLAVVVLDERQQIVAVQQLLVPLQIPDADLAAAREQHYRGLIQLELPRGELQLGLGLWDGVHHRGSFLVQALEIGDG